MLQSCHLLSSPFPLLFISNYSPYRSFPPRPFTFSTKPIGLSSVSPQAQAKPELWLAELPESTAVTTIVQEEGPIELPPSFPSIFSTTDDPSTIQIATSVLLTGSISVFLFRALRRRAKRAKALQFRSSGVKKSLKEEALDSLKAMSPAPVEADSPTSPLQALLGGITAGVIALILYKFTTTIEAALNRQTISESFSVRQITITVRTIINGICYLATFVFGFNSIGLLLYSAQLTLNSIMGASSSKQTESKGMDQLDSSSTTAETPREIESSEDDQGSNNIQ